jgi:hypothetical protein
MNFRHIVFTCLTVVVGAYLIRYHDAARYVLSADPTHVTLVIAAIYAFSSLYLFHPKTNLYVVRWYARKLTGVGLIGTIIGIMLLCNDMKNMTGEAASAHLTGGLGPVFITTAFGVAAWLLLELQVAFCFRRYDDE